MALTAGVSGLHGQSEALEVCPGGLHPDQSARIGLTRPRRGRAETTIADDQAGAALGKLEFHPRVAKQRTVVVGVYIDEARSEAMPAGVDGDGVRALGVVRQISDTRDPVAGDGHVAGERLLCGAVDDRCVADDQIGCGVGSR